jgi:hypothetical protein
MATALIDTRKSILSQIHDSWNHFRTTKCASEFMFGTLNCYKKIPLAEDFTKYNTPWSNNPSVLERNVVHANNLIRLYIALNIDVAERMSIWQFFEIQNGVVGKIKEQIQTLNRVAKVLKKQQQYGIVLSNSTDMFLCRGDCILHELEFDMKLKVKQAKELATKGKLIAAIVKKNSSRTDGSLHMGNIDTSLSVKDLRLILKTLPLLIKANKAEARKRRKHDKNMKKSQNS